MYWFYKVVFLTIVNPVLFIRQHNGMHRVNIFFMDLICLTPHITSSFKDNYLAHLFNIKRSFILHVESLTYQISLTQ
jgi:hypothetical protein